MPYNGAGTFNREHDWTEDRDNAININAERMDEEMDGMAAGLSNAICKDGQTTTTASIPFAQGISTDTISEESPGAGVTVDGTLMKDKTIAPDSADANTYISVPAADTVAITTDGSERMRVDSSGNVLIGAASTPSGLSAAQVQVVGDGTFRHLSVGRITNDGNPPTLYLQKSRGTGASAMAAVQSGDNIGLINFRAYDGTSSVSAASIAAAVDGTPGTNDMPTRLAFSTTADGASSPTERMRIDSSGVVKMDTIGELTSAAGVTIDGVLLKDGVALASDGSAGTPTYTFADDPDTGLFRAGANILGIAASGTERIRFTPTGIGVQLNTDIQMGTTTGRILYLYNASPTNLAYISTGASGEILLANGVGTVANRLMIDSTGILKPFADNTYTLGGTGFRWSAVWAATGTIQTSDARDKADVQDSALGLDFINALRPVSYKWIVGGNVVTSEQDGVDEEGNPVYRTVVTSRPGVRTHWGLLAQEVKAACDAAGVDFGGYIEAEDGKLGLRYDQFIAPLIKAVQELKAANDALAARVSALEASP